MSKDGRYALIASPKDEDLRAIMHQLNSILARISRRLDAMEKVGVKKPSTVRNVTVDGKQGCFNIVWERVQGVSGYIIEGASDTAMTQTINNIPQYGEHNVTCQIPVGNVSVTRSFRIWAFISDGLGKIVMRGDPSSVVTASTAAFGAGEAAPTNPPVAPLRPEKEAELEVA